MAAISRPTRRNLFLPQLKALISTQKFNQTIAGSESTMELAADSNLEPNQIDILKWRKLDSRGFGITAARIPQSSWIVLKVLKQKGFEAYLVGGCVRDLLLNKIPKDFDVITTATLRQIKRQFHRAEIVGRRFPICRVHIQRTVVEVSCFDTVANQGEERKNVSVSRMPKGCDVMDFIRWRNSFERDFTINSLFYDPFVNKIYDYANAMVDLKSLKLRTLKPAQLSFEEDCARILRGLRLAARLNFSFSMGTETAIRKLSPAIMKLSKSRLMMEVNYMLSYGAAMPSLRLLQRYNLLEVLLPFHAAYLSQQTFEQSNDNSFMLMKLFSSLDRLVSCDRPAHDSLWVALLAFHLALVNTPQHMLVVLTFASVLYHGQWKQGAEFARQHAKASCLYVPEISDSDDFISEDELAERVKNMAVKIQTAAYMLNDAGNLQEMLSKCSDSSHSGLVFVSKNMAKSVAAFFDTLVNDDVTSLETERQSLQIDYASLGKGEADETRFVLGRIILETLGLGAFLAEDVRTNRNNIFHQNVQLQKLHTVKKENSHSQMEMKQKDNKMKAQDSSDEKGFVHQNPNINNNNNSVKKKEKNKRAKKKTVLEDVKNQEGNNNMTKQRKSADESEFVEQENGEKLGRRKPNMNKQEKSVDESEFVRQETSEVLGKRKVEFPS